MEGDLGWLEACAMRDGWHLESDRSGVDLNMSNSHSRDQGSGTKLEHMTVPDAVAKRFQPRTRRSRDEQTRVTICRFTAFLFDHGVALHQRFTVIYVIYLVVVDCYFSLIFGVDLKK